LEKENTPFAEKTISTLRAMSPTALKVALRVIREGAHLGIADCFKMEYQLSYHLVRMHDFVEGVRSLLIEKTPQPKWEPATIEKVDTEVINQIFKIQPSSAFSLSNSTSWMEYPHSRYGLPSENEIHMAFASENGGSFQLTAGEVAEVCAKKISSRIGVKEKAMELLSRNAWKAPECKL
jgi:3-hydroxyisobutyryl-CoA hydrolase